MASPVSEVLNFKSMSLNSLQQMLLGHVWLSKAEKGGGKRKVKTKKEKFLGENETLVKWSGW